MRVGILADIHGNAPALTAVLTAAKNANVTRLIIAGDFVGYYYEPDRVMALLDDWHWTGVRGNHEDLLTSWKDETKQRDITHRYGSGIAAAFERLSASQRECLEMLPACRQIEIDRCRVMIGHGSPWSTNEYIYPDAAEAVRNRFTILDVDLVVLGHTHYPMIWQIEHLQVVNPGSVGQPRDSKPGACWAIWDTQTGTLQHRRESYDIQSVVEQAARMDPNNNYLREVLLRDQ